MPPLVSALGPWHLATGALENEDVLDKRTFLESSINDQFGCNRLATTPALVAGKENTRFAVLNTITERLRAETSENNGMNGSNSCTGEEGSNSLPGHWKVYRYSVALLHAEAFENVCNGADLTEQLRIGDEAAILRFICLVDNGGLIDDRE